MEKIQELTEKIYREGVEKGQAAADRIIEDAKQTAEQIIAEAREQAKAIEVQAQKKAAELDANTKSELKLYTSQALNALKSEIANVLTDKVAKDAAAGLAADKNFLGQFAVMLASKWAGNEAIVLSSSIALAKSSADWAFSRLATISRHLISGRLPLSYTFFRRS